MNTTTYDLYLNGKAATSWTTEREAIANGRKWLFDGIVASVVRREYFPEFDFCEIVTVWNDSSAPDPPAHQQARSDRSMTTMYTVDETPHEDDDVTVPSTGYPAGAAYPRSLLEAINDIFREHGIAPIATTRPHDPPAIGETP